jgi:hypothetical protein
MQQELLDAIAEYQEQIEQLQQLTDDVNSDDQEALQVSNSPRNPSCNIATVSVLHCLTGMTAAVIQLLNDLKEALTSSQETYVQLYGPLPAHGDRHQLGEMLANDRR